MSEHLFKNLKLTIISDSGMDKSKYTYLFEPVFREVNKFCKIFTHVHWVGYKLKKYDPVTFGKRKKENSDIFYINHFDKKPLKKRLKKYRNIDIPNNISIIPIKFSGGKSILAKFVSIIYSPYYLFIILKSILKADIVHTRGPSIPALITIIVSVFFPKKIFWHKYAGNWQFNTKTISYRLQKWLLKRKMLSIVTVAERNDYDPNHIYSITNPCLFEDEYIRNSKIARNKDFQGKLTFCFVGRLDDSKGFRVLLDTIKELEKVDYVEKFHIVGDGPLKKLLKDEIKKLKTAIIYHGLMHRADLDKIYSDSHFIVLPSQSEGFPKVISEASSFGCIPIVTPIVSVAKSLNRGMDNAIVMDGFEKYSLIETLMYISNNYSILPSLSKSANIWSKNCTYENYIKGICSIISDNNRILNLKNV